MKTFSSAERVLIDRDPGLVPGYIFAHHPWGTWWVADERWDGHSAGVWGFCRRFEVAEACELRIHVSADQRFDLYLDGHCVGWGPERGDPSCWFYTTFDMKLAPGTHVLAARLWWGGKSVLAPYGHMTVEPGFMVHGEGAAHELLSTGVAEWESLPLTGVTCVPPQVRDSFCVSGGRVEIDGAKYPWGFEKGEGEGWQAVRKVLPASLRSQGNEAIYQWWLRRAVLPPMYEGCVKPGRVRWVGAAWDEETALTFANGLDGETGLGWGHHRVVVAAGMTRHVLFDLENYVCAWAAVKCSGGKGGEIRVAWAESLFTETKWFEKGNRSEIEGKYFRGLYDTYTLDGNERMYAPLWWTSGRYVMVSITARQEPVAFERLDIRETHYPYAFESEFECSDARWGEVEPVARRVLEMCSHESYMDCPYYEQLMYVGDTRLEVLTTYALTHDDRLPRKAIWMFDLSRRDGGLTTSRYPTREKQIIPTFSMWWVMMVHDFLMWRNDAKFVRQRLPGVRAVLEAIRANIRDDGLLHAPLGWNFVDWPKNWEKGMPPGAESGANGVINLHAAWVFRVAAELETWAGEPLLARRNRDMAEQLATNAELAFWDEARGLFADNLERTAFSEHAQCMAILGGFFDAKAEGLLHRMLTTEMTRATIYFSFYLFEAFAKTNALHHAYPRFELWFNLRKQGFYTTPECPEPTRSDCHAWGAHPMFHAFANLCGIRPAAPGFAAVRIVPQPCGSKMLKAVMPHPQGEIVVDLHEENGRWTGLLAAPHNVPCDALLPDGTRLSWSGGTHCVSNQTGI